MKGLLMETSGDNSWIALTEEDEVIQLILLEGQKGLSCQLAPALQTLIKDLTYISVGIGPGSFAGTRTGATLAKTLAFALGVPLIGFPSPLGYLPPLKGSFAFVADAKMKQYYLLEGYLGETLQPSQLVSLEALKLDSVDWIICSQCLFPQWEGRWVAPTPAPKRIARLSLQKLSQGDFSLEGQLELAYYRLINKPYFS